MMHPIFAQIIEMIELLHPYLPVNVGVIKQMLMHFMEFVYRLPG